MFGTPLRADRRGVHLVACNPACSGYSSELHTTEVAIIVVGDGDVVILKVITTPSLELFDALI